MGRKNTSTVLILIIGFLCGSLATVAQPDFLKNYNGRWVDSVFQNMTLDHKIGQLLMPRGNFSGKPHDIPQLVEWVEKYKIGGVVFFAGNPTIQVDITNQLQALSDVPLFIGQDFEWGTAMRLDSTVRFPYALALGALTKDIGLIEEMGDEVGKHCKRLGVHINYAPVVDINNNPGNPVINFRSFGENREDVTQKALLFVKGMNKNRIISTAKHFPGHGNTNVDSHYDLPIIHSSIEELRKTELYPFKALIENGIPGIMTAHIYVPALDNSKNVPATLSRKTITDLLRNEMKFEGLVFTDAMDMQAIVKNFTQGEAIVKALIAGNDIIETFLDVPTAVEAIKKAIRDGRLTQQWLDFKVRKILKAKSWVGLDHFLPIPRDYIFEDINSHRSHVINQALAEKSITILKNENSELPLKKLNQKIALVSISPPRDNKLVEMLENYTRIDHFEIDRDSIDSLDLNQLKQSLRGYDQILVATYITQVRPAQKYGLNEGNIHLINELGKLPSSILIWLGNPYGLDFIDIQNYTSIITGYQQTPYTQQVIAQSVFGGLEVSGKLPVSINTFLQAGNQFSTQPTGYLSYGSGDLIGLDGKMLEIKVDSMMEMALENDYFPGGVVQVSYKNKVVLQKAYGQMIYEEGDFEGKKLNQPPDMSDVMDSRTSGIIKNVPSFGFNLKKQGLSEDAIYDLASITKIAASALALMTWVSENKLKLDDPLYKYLPEFKNYPVGKASFRDMLTHRSGLQAWIPFWKTTIDSTQTLKNALALKPELKSYCVVDIKKPFFLARWFGKKPKEIINIKKTVQANNKELWDKVFLPGCVTWKKGYYSNIKEGIYTTPISDSLWLRKDFDQEIYRQIVSAPMGNKGTYVYSDLHYYFYPLLSQKITGQSFENYLSKIYDELGLSSFHFNPLHHVDKKDIVPTERDSVFRNTLIHGKVHDEGAIMMGGVSGHAGLFGNANDLNKLMYLYLNDGEYGGKRYIDKKVLEEFTRYQFPEEKNRRGLVFDKKDIFNDMPNAPSLSSQSGFGHSGFTGTFTWVDPSYDLVFVFLSNRVYPTRLNTKISKYDFRQNLCDEVYKIILSSP